MDTYHRAICGRDLSEIMSYVARGFTCSSLIVLHVLRILAIALQSGQHPLEMNEVRYLTPGASKVAAWDSYRSFFFYMDMLKTLGSCPFRDIAKLDFWVYYTLTQKLTCNTFGEYKAPQKPANGMLFPFSSFLNHSCKPNAHYVTEKSGRRLVYANEQIEKGQQVFISYCDINLPVLKRQSLFHGTFGFVCKCERCLLQLGTDNEDEIRKKVSGQYSMF